MLVSMNAMRLYEMVSHYALTTNKHILCIDNTKWFDLDDTKKATIKTYYEDVIPEDEIDEVFGNKLSFYAFETQVIAVDTAHDWFPQSNDLDDSDYFIECYVINPSGAMPYTNKIPKRPTE